MRFFLFCIFLVAAGCSGAHDNQPDISYPHNYKDVVVISNGDTEDSSAYDVDQLECFSNAQCPEELPFCDKLNKVCVQCIVNSDCPDEKLCDKGKCVNKLCVEGDKFCKGNTSFKCNPTLDIFVEKDCSPLKCIDGECLVCKPYEKGCSENRATVCNPDGMGYTYTDCGSGTCVNGACKFCVPGYKKCEGTKIYMCNEAGDAFEYYDDCKTEETGEICYLGLCVAMCEFNKKFKTNWGCEYFAADLDQCGYDIGDCDNSPYAIIVSNTSKKYKTKVKVYKPDGTVVSDISVAPQSLSIINLEPFNISGPSKEKKSYRIESLLPIIAYQFNPLENVGVYSNDASLLLPTNVLGKKYFVMSWEGRPSFKEMIKLGSYFTVIAVEDGTTKVKFRVTAQTKEGGGIPALMPGQEFETTLEKFEILNVVSDVPKGDLTGTYIEADRRIAVFGGHQCANVPIDVCCCDHLEEQLIPVNSWGKFYVVGKSVDRGKAPDYIRILASEDNTSVSVDPPVVSVPKLNAGKYFDFTTHAHCVITSDKPVLVGQYLAGQDAPVPGNSKCEDTLIFGKKCDGNPFGKSCNTDKDCSPDDANIGDPAFFIIPPVEQFRNDYIFLAPNKYAEDYVTIVAPSGAKVFLNGSQIHQSQFKAIGSGAYQASQFLINDGVHTISSDMPLGVSVYGWDEYVSYGYAAGMKVETINLK